MKCDIHFAPGNAFELDFNELFDGVIVTEIIEHVAHPDEFLAKVSRLIKPGGYIFMSTPNGAYFFNKLPRFSDCPNPEQFESIQFKPNSDGHIFLLWPDELRSLASEAGVELISMDHFTTPLLNGHLKLGLLLPWAPKPIVAGLDKLAMSLPPRLKSRLAIHSICLLSSFPGFCLSQ